MTHDEQAKCKNCSCVLLGMPHKHQETGQLSYDSLENQPNYTPTKSFNFLMKSNAFK